MVSAEREPIMGSGGSDPSGVQGQSPWWGLGGRSPLKLKAFCTFLHKKWPKVKDLSENLSPCLSRATKASPKFWSMGGAAALTAHSWIRHCFRPTDSRTFKDHGIVGFQGLSRP